MAVRGSGMAWVIVQPSSFFETSLRPSSGFDPALGKAAVLGTGEAPVSYISVRVRDEARAAVVDRVRLILGGAGGSRA